MIEGLAESDRAVIFRDLRIAEHHLRFATGQLERVDRSDMVAVQLQLKLARLQELCGGLHAMCSFFESDSVQLDLIESVEA